LAEARYTPSGGASSVSAAEARPGQAGTAASSSSWRRVSPV